MFETSVYEDWQAVLRPKVSGAINLHRALVGAPLEFFICLSSAAAMMGNVGQASYSASNAILDSFCRWRNVQGLPASSLNLPAVSDVGYVAETLSKRTDNVDRAMEDYLMNCSVSEAQVHLVVQVMASRGYPSNISHQCLIGVPFKPEFASRSWSQAALFSHYNKQCLESRGTTGDVNATTQGPLLKEKLVLQTEFDAVFNMVFEAVCSKIASIMMIAEEDITPQRSIADLGLDSLVAVELRNWIVKQFDANLSVVDTTQSGTVGTLVKLVIEKSTLTEVCTEK